MSDYIPKELVTQILLRLPVKSLIRCSAVCKSWKSLLGSSAFIDSHRSCQDYNPLLLRITTNDDTDSPERCLLHFPETGEFNRLKVPPPLLSRRRPIIAVHGCNSLIIMYDRKETWDDPFCLVICNPSIRRFVNLPAPKDVNYDDEDVEASYQIGYDTVANDYKVLRVLMTDPWIQAQWEPWNVMVYSLANSSWKTLRADVVPTGYVGSCVDRGVLLNNALHWFREASKGRDCCIVVFDMHKEIYSEMAAPDVEPRLLEKNSMSQYLGSLAVVNISEIIGLTPVVRVWVMIEYGVTDSWKLLYSVRLQGLPGQYPSSHGLTRKGEFMPSLREHGMYCVKSGEAVRIEVEGSDWCFMDSFVESLVLLGQANAISY